MNAHAWTNAYEDLDLLSIRSMPRALIGIYREDFFFSPLNQCVCDLPDMLWQKEAK